MSHDPSHFSSIVHSRRELGLAGSIGLLQRTISLPLSYSRKVSPVATFVPASVPFLGLESTQESLRRCLSGLSLTDTLFWCARLNQVLSLDGVRQRVKQEFFLGHFFDSEQIARINQFAANNGGADNVVILHRGQILELVRWVTHFLKDEANDGETFNCFKTRQVFAQAALICSILWSEQVFGNEENIQKRMLNRVSFMASARRAISSTSAALDAETVFGRAGLLIRKFLCQEFEFEEQFQNATGLDLDEYLTTMCAIHLGCSTKATDEGRIPHMPSIFRLEELQKQFPLKADALSVATRLESQTSVDLKNSLWGDDNPSTSDTSQIKEINFGALRSAAILKSQDGRMIILDPTSFADRITVGSLFHVTKAATCKQKADAGFQSFGDAFEKYVSFILSSICARQRKRLGVDVRLEAPLLKLIANEEISDVCISAGKDLLLLEAKGKWLRDSAVWAIDDEVYEKNLLDKYEVGLKQLARAIKGIASNSLSAQNIDVGNVDRIFPILSVYDDLFDVPGHSEFLNKRFVQLLPKCQWENDGFIRLLDYKLVLSPLLILTSSTLEMLETSSKDFDLFDFLSDFVGAFSKQSISLRSFLFESGHSYEIRKSALLAGFGLPIVERASKDYGGERKETKEETEESRSAD